MKKYSLGLLTIFMAVLLAAFTNIKVPEKKKLEDLYWFSVPGSISNTATLTNSDVSYLGAHQPSDPSPASCPGGSKYCHVGFRATQVSGSGGSITLNGTQTPISFNSKQ